MRSTYNQSWVQQSLANLRHGSPEKKHPGTTERERPQGHSERKFREIHMTCHLPWFDKEVYALVDLKKHFPGDCIPEQRAFALKPNI